MNSLIITFHISFIICHWISAELANSSSCSMMRKYTLEQFYFMLHFCVHLRVDHITTIGNSITDMYDK